jgi:hypothetical protein
LQVLIFDHLIMSRGTPRGQLFMGNGLSDSISTRSLTRVVVPTVSALLERLGTTPAFVVVPANDVLAGNRAWGRFVGPLGMLESAEPNLARYVFLHRDARSVYPDWTAAADDQVARLRAASVRWGDNEQFAKLMDGLRTAPDFVERWSKFARTEKRRGATRILHPDFGHLRINDEVLLPDEVDEQRLITWLQPTIPPPMLLRPWVTLLLHRVPRSFASSGDGTSTPKAIAPGTRRYATLSALSRQVRSGPRSRRRLCSRSSPERRLQDADEVAAWPDSVVL